MSIKFRVLGGGFFGGGGKCRFYFYGREDFSENGGFPDTRTNPNRADPKPRESQRNERRVCEDRFLRLGGGADMTANERSWFESQW